MKFTIENLFKLLKEILIAFLPRILEIVARAFNVFTRENLKYHEILRLHKIISIYSERIKSVFENCVNHYLTICFISIIYRNGKRCKKNCRINSVFSYNY